jgi:UDP:flavonoid glycosyltransferase YjiC (YdhE family)
MTRIIVAVTPIPGHVAPLRRIAADLAGRGHDVVFVTGSLFEKAAKDVGLRFVRLSGIADYSPERQAEVMAGRAEIPPGPAQLNYEFIRLFYEPVPDQHQTIQQVLAEAPDVPTILITDQSFVGHWPLLLGASGVRPRASIGIGIVPLAMNSVDTAPFGLALPPDSSPAGRARNAEQNRMVEAMFGESTAVLREILADLGARDEIPFPMDGIVSLPQRFLQLTTPDVEYARSDAPPGLSFVGSLPAEPAGENALPPWWGDVLAAENVILVTQGTMANLDLSQLIEPAVRGLAGWDALVVVTTGRPDATLDTVGDNVRVADFIPYSALLPYTDVMVTNGGYGGSLQAVDAGVPLVIAGLSEDKIEVSARLAWTGAAINLATDTPQPDAIAEAVRAAMGDSSYRDSARRLQAASRRYQPFDAIARTVDELGDRG